MSSAADIPQAYLDSEVEFMGRKFMVNPTVLIPRIETEQLVNEVIKLNPSSVVDVGTGSGCIAIILAKNLADAEIYATDISEEALKIAKLNATDLPITFIKANLIADLVINPEIIVANLPYIPSARIPTLDASVKDFEPILALDGGPDGFALYRQLFAQVVAQKLSPKYLLAEIDDTHGKLALQEVKNYFPDSEAWILTDFAGLHRILVIKYVKKTSA